MPRPRVGLALSGGVARGPAHLGVLLALERAGIEVDVVAGTSAGAVAGALFCGGISLAAIEAQLARFGWRQIARLVWPRRGWFSFAPLETWLGAALGDPAFADLPRQLAVTATDIATGEPVRLSQGRVLPAVHASCAVPGLAEPVELDGRLLCDGGVSNNLPVAAARALGADYVIGVDLFSPAPVAGAGPLRHAVAAVENLVRRSGGGLDDCDCLIAPAVAGTNYLRFSAWRTMLARGVAAAEASLPQLQAALAA